jgi:hypothetical protein
MTRHGENKGNIVRYDPSYDGYYIVLNAQDAQSPVQGIDWCPWCGEKLPESLYEKWHDTLEALGIDWLSDTIPEHFQTDEWRTKARSNTRIE